MSQKAENLNSFPVGNAPSSGRGLDPTTAEDASPRLSPTGKRIPETWKVYRCGTFHIIRENRDKFRLVHQDHTITHLNMAGMRELIEMVTMAYSDGGSEDI